MKRILFFMIVLSLVSFKGYTQLGTANMAKMNALLQQYGGKVASPLKYEATYGMVDQTVGRYTDHYSISNIKEITVRKVEGGYTVQFSCDSTDPCISHTNIESNGIYLPGVTYSFSLEKPANSFAHLAAEIIRTDFKKEVKASYTAFDNPPTEVSSKKEQPTEKTVPVKKIVTPKKPKGSHLSVDAYGDNGEQDFKKTLSKFGMQLMQIYQLAEKQQLEQIKGGAANGAQQSKVKLPKAKKNYINQYKGEDCFIAEFGTKKYSEALQELYDEVKDEIEEALPEDYESLDMAYEKIYENSDDEVFHTEYYHNKDPKMPSIVIRIAPDGKRNTLFLRIGKR